MIAVCICTLNNLKLLLRLVPRLLSVEEVDRIIIYDNGSSDDTDKYLRALQSFYAQKLLLLGGPWSENLGVTIARNRCLERSMSTYSMILDDDQFLSDHTFKRYLDALCSYDIVGYIPGMINSAGAVVVNTGDQFNHVGEGGLCMKTSLWKALNYFDEAFSPAYFEGPDIQLRAIMRGKRIACIRNAGIVHYESVTLKRQDTGFNRSDVGSRNLQIILGRVRSGYYESACAYRGEYF